MEVGNSRKGVKLSRERRGGGENAEMLSKRTVLPSISNWQSDCKLDCHWSESDNSEQGSVSNWNSSAPGRWLISSHPIPSHPIPLLTEPLSHV